MPEEGVAQADAEVRPGQQAGHVQQREAVRGLVPPRRQPEGCTTTSAKTATPTSASNNSTTATTTTAAAIITALKRRDSPVILRQLYDSYVWNDGGKCIVGDFRLGRAKVNKQNDMNTIDPGDSVLQQGEHNNYLDAASSVDFPALGSPIMAASEMMRSSRRSHSPRSSVTSPRSENIGTLRRAFLKCLLPRPPRPPRATSILGLLSLISPINDPFPSA